MASCGYVVFGVHDFPLKFDIVGDPQAVISVQKSVVDCVLAARAPQCLRIGLVAETCLSDLGLELVRPSRDGECSKLGGGVDLERKPKRSGRSPEEALISLSAGHKGRDSRDRLVLTPPLFRAILFAS